MVLSKREEDRLKKVYEYLDNNKDGKICVNDLHQTLLSMKYEADKKELEEWIWEVRLPDDSTPRFNSLLCQGNLIHCCVQVDEALERSV